MKVITLPMFDKDNNLLELDYLLSFLPDNNWFWSMMFYYGIGHAPDGLTLMEFEETVRSAPQGFHFSWKDLNAFACELKKSGQIYDCLLIAVEKKEDVISEDIKADNFEHCIVVLEAQDSTQWVIHVKEGKEDTKLFFEKLQNTPVTWPVNSNLNKVKRGPAIPL